MGHSPDSTAIWNFSVFSLWSSFTRVSFSASEITVSGHPTSLKYLVILSFPPPVLSSSPYWSTPHSALIFLEANAWFSKYCYKNPLHPYIVNILKYDITWLNVTLCASRSVSAMTPSQSNNNASKLLYNLMLSVKERRFKEVKVWNDFTRIWLLNMKIIIGSHDIDYMRVFDEKTNGESEYDCIYI